MPLHLLNSTTNKTTTTTTILTKKTTITTNKTTVTTAILTKKTTKRRKRNLKKKPKNNSPATQATRAQARDPGRASASMQPRPRKPRPRGLGRLRPGSQATCFCVRAQATPAPGHTGEVSGEVSPNSFSLFSYLGSSLFVLVFFFFFFSSLICSGFLFDIYKVGNRVLETQFPCVRHVEKHATLDHKNWVSNTQFLGQNRVS